MNLRHSNKKNNLWYDTARWFAGLPPDEAIYRLLGRLGTLHQAGRTRFASFEQSQTHIRITHEWCAKGVASTLSMGRDLSKQTYRLVNRKLERQREIYIASLDKIPNRYRDLRIPFTTLGVRSFYCVAVVVNDKLVAALAHHAVHHARRWSRTERKQMREAALILSDMLRARLNQKGKAVDAPVPEAKVFIRKGTTSTAVPVRQIVRIEADLNYCQVHFTSGRYAIQYGSMESWDKTLPAKYFLRIHRSHIINLREIAKFSRNGGSWRLTLTDRSVIPVGRKYQEELLQRLKKQERFV